MINTKGNRMKTINKSLLASAIALSFTASNINTVFAAESNAAEDEIEVIQVTGIKGSIVQSMNNKRFSNYIVDTISAEDVGKFPDANIAESLQRITGVSIDRSGGEGQFVTIRGLGPEFNSVLFNGRMLATDTAGRSFSLDTLASETISAVDVYKSGNAELTEGGIGGTVSINTARPFDKEGFRAVATAKALHTDSSGETEPQFSFLVSNTFLDDRLGVLASFNHQERTQTNKEVVNFQNVPGNLTLNRGPLWHGGEKRVIEDVTRPQSLGREVTHETRERNSGTLVVQYQASDDLLITADALYSEFDVNSDGYAAGTWFWYPTGAYEDTVGGLDPILDSETDRNVVFMQHGSTGMSSAYREKSRPSDLASFGLNLEWEINDDLSLNADAFWSNARNKNKGYNTQTLIESGPIGYVEWDYTAGGNYPKLIQNNGTIPSEENIGNIFPAHYEARGNYIDAENVGIKFDFTWQSDIDHLTAVKFGAHYSVNEKSNQEYRENTASSRIYKQYAKHNTVKLYVPEELLEVKSLDGGWDGISDIAHTFKSVDDYVAWMANPASLEQLNAHPGLDDAVSLFNDNGGFTAQESDNSYNVEETVTALYASANFDFDLGDMPLNVVAGVRYVQTDLSSAGTIQQLVDLIPGIPSEDDPNAHNKLEKVYAANGDFVHTKQESDYSEVLPSIIANLHITDEIILRAGTSKTMTRPTLNDVAPWINYGNTHVVEGNAATGSNPALKPYLSTNIDLSLEWYYDDASMLSIAYFTKNVDDWIVREDAIETIDLLTSPHEEVTVQRPRNIETAEIDGYEVNWIHTLENGLGLQANYTGIDSNAELGTDSTFALEGLADSANLVAFYEKGPLQVRIAYNWRDEFLQDTFVGWTGTPQYVGEYEQIDASASYEINDNVTVFVEALNITDEATRKYGRHKNQFLQYLETGPRYSLGLRASF